MAKRSNTIASKTRFDIISIIDLARDLVASCRRLEHTDNETLRLGHHRFVAVYHSADELDRHVNPNGLEPADYCDIEAADLDNETRSGLMSLRERFDRCLHRNHFLGKEASREASWPTWFDVGPNEWADHIEEAVEELHLAVAPKRIAPLYEGWFTDAQIADIYDVPLQALRARLKRRRERSWDSGDWKEIQNPTKNEPRYLFRLSAVLRDVVDLRQHTRSTNVRAKKTQQR